MIELGIGIIVASLLTGWWACVNEKSNRIRELISRGNRIDAEVVKVDVIIEKDEKISGNGRINDNYLSTRGSIKTIEQHKYIIQCKWGANGQKLMFLSEPLDWDPTAFINRTIPVYIDKADNKNYYVATGRLKDN